MNITLDQIQNLTPEEENDLSRYIRKCLIRNRKKARDQYEQELEREQKCQM